MFKKKITRAVVSATLAISAGIGFPGTASADTTDLVKRIEFFYNNPTSEKFDSSVEPGEKAPEPFVNEAPNPPAPAPATSQNNEQFLSVKDTSIMDNYWRNMQNIRVDNNPNPSGYNRELFKHWELIGTEVTKDEWPDSVPRSCNARRAVLVRDGHDLEVNERCKIKVLPNGGWRDPYGYEKGGQIGYLEDVKPTKFDIDHIVALSDAWRSGASQWDDAKRQAIANDPLNLSLSSASANRFKGDKSPSDYMPPGVFRCEYAKRYAAVKAKYQLATTQKDIDVLADTGKKCGF